MRDIAEVIGRHLNLPVEDAGEHFGFLGSVYSLDIAASSILTQQFLGWQPVQPGLLADIEQGHYFKS